MEGGGGDEGEGDDPRQDLAMSKLWNNGLIAEKRVVPVMAGVSSYIYLGTVKQRHTTIQSSTLPISKGGPALCKPAESVGA